MIQEQTLTQVIERLKALAQEFFVVADATVQDDQPSEFRQSPERLPRQQHLHQLR